jgi:hypothetical protein
MTGMLELGAAVLEGTSLSGQVQTLVARLHPKVSVERRLDQRYPLPVLMKLTPIDSLRRPLVDSAVIVLGKDISRCGISFFHERPLPYRRAIVSLEHPDFGWFAAEVDINWCRFTKPGWYISGGRLVGEVCPERLAQIASPVGVFCLGHPPTAAGAEGHSLPPQPV